MVEVKTMTSDRNQIFISHRSVDAPIADMIKDFLVNTGIPNDKVFCSSLPGNDVNEKISPEVKQQLQKSIINILILSKDYYQSAYCLNEAGVAWYLDEAVAVPIGLPEINHTNMIGFLNNDYKLRKLDNDADISYLYDTAQEKLQVKSVKHSVIARETTKLKNRYTQYIESRYDNQQTDKNEAENTRTVSIGKDEGVLLVYAASDSAGQIMMIRTITQTAPSISAGKYEFVSEDTAKEGARWKTAIEKLEMFGLIEAVGYKREIFNVTHQGYKFAEQVKDIWDIDTDKSPDEYLD